MSADLEFKQLIDRILRCREAEDDAKQDTKEIYAELKSRGYDKTAAGALVAEIRKKDKNPDKFEERNAVLDLYRNVYERASHAHTREAEPIQAPKARPEVVAKSMAHVDTPAPGKGLAKELSEADNSDGMQDEEAIHPVTHSEPQAISSRPALTAGEVGQSSPISPAFSNPRCREPETCALAHTRDCCFDCLVAWSKRPATEQVRLWQEACEAIA